MMCIGLTACGSLDERLSRASAEKAVAEAKTTLPDLPPYCDQKMTRIKPQEGEKWRGVQLRWETAADASDARTAFCASFYRKTQSRFGGAVD